MVPTQLIGVLPAPVLQVYARLAGYGTYNETEAAYEDCFPAVETLTQALGKKSKRPVQECLRTLEDMGLIIGKARAGQTTNYTVRVGGAAVEALLEGMLKTAGVVTSQGVQETARGDAENSTPPLRKTAPNLEPDIKNQEVEAALRASSDAQTTQDVPGRDSPKLENEGRIDIDQSKPTPGDLERVRAILEDHSPLEPGDRERLRAFLEYKAVEIRTFANNLLTRVVEQHGPVRGRSELLRWALAQTGPGRVMRVFQVALDTKQYGANQRTIEVAVSKAAQTQVPSVREVPEVEKVREDQERLHAAEQRLRDLAGKLEHRLMAQAAISQSSDQDKEQIAVPPCASQQDSQPGAADPQLPSEPLALPEGLPTQDVVLPKQCPTRLEDGHDLFAEAQRQFDVDAQRRVAEASTRLGELVAEIVF